MEFKVIKCLNKARIVNQFIKSVVLRGLDPLKVALSILRFYNLPPISLIKSPLHHLRIVAWTNKSFISIGCIREFPLFGLIICFGALGRAAKGGIERWLLGNWSTITSASSTGANISTVWWWWCSSGAWLCLRIGLNLVSWRTVSVVEGRIILYVG